MVTHSKFVAHGLMHLYPDTSEPCKKKKKIEEWLALTHPLKMQAFKEELAALYRNEAGYFSLRLLIS